MSKRIMAAATWLCLSVVALGTASAQEGMAAGARQFQVMNLLKRPALRAELELVDTQIEDLIELEVERQELYRSPLGELKQVTLEERKVAHEEVVVYRGVEESARSSP